MFNFDLIRFEIKVKNTEELKKTIKRLENFGGWHDKLLLKWAKKELKTRSK